MQERWEAVQASETPRRLRRVVGMKKRKAVDSYFHAIRNTVGKNRSVIMPYGNGSFPRPSKDEDSVPRGSMKRHLLTRSAGEHRTSRGCLFCQKNDFVSVTADGRVQENSTSLHWRRCTACNRAEEAGCAFTTSSFFCPIARSAPPPMQRCTVLLYSSKIGRASCRERVCLYV